MKYINKYLVFIVFVLFSHNLWSQENGFSVSCSLSEPVKVNPYEIISIPIMIKNYEGIGRQYKLDVKYPSHLKLLSKDNSLKIESKDSSLALFTFQVAKNAYEDTFSIDFSVAIENGMKHSLEKKVFLFIPVKYILSIQPMEIPSFTNTGGSILAKYSIINKSNANVDIQLNLNKDSKDELFINPTKISLIAGETKYFSVEGNIYNDRNLSSIKRCLFTVNAEVTKKDTIVFKSARSENILVYPHFKMNSKYFSLINSLTVRTIKETNLKQAFQVDIEGNIANIPLLSSSLRYFFRTPDIKDRTRFFYYQDYYNIQLNSKFFNLTLGDDSYYLSEATESGRNGFGAKAKIKISNFEIDVLNQNDRIYSSGLHEIGTSVKYKFGTSENVSDYSIGLNYLNKKMVETNNIYSVSGEINKIKFAKFKFEYAQDDYNNDSQNLYSLSLSGTIPKINYGIIYRHSSPFFSGSYKDVNDMQFTISYSPTYFLSFSSHFNDYKSNIENNINQPSPHNRNIGSIINLKTKDMRWYGIIKYRNFLWEDEASSIENSIELNDYYLGFGYRSNTLSSFLSSEMFAYSSNSYTPDYSYVMSSFNIGYNYLSKYFISTIFDYFMYDNSPMFYNYSNRMQFSIKTKIELSSTSRFVATYKNDNILKNNNYFSSNTIFYDAGFEQYLFDNHRLGVYAKYYDYNNSVITNHLSFLAEYKFSFSIPVWKKDVSITNISGRLYDSENPELGIGGVTLYADGKTAVTDNKGYYTFEDMKPDLYFLELNRLTLAPGKTTVQKTPIEVKLKEGDEAKVDIGVVRSASITGKVMLYDFEEKKSLDTTQLNIKKSYGLPDFQIYMHNGRPDIYSATTDSKGNFSYRDLPPGHWVIKVISGDYPDYHYLESDSVGFNLLPGEKKDLLFRVLPRVRPIKIAVVTDTIKTEEEIKPPVETVPKIPLSIGVARRFNYDPWSDSLDAMTRSYLNDVAQYILDNRNFMVSIEGHTDNIGGIAVTQRTSIQKAQLVRNYLMKKGVPSGNILTQGLGSRRPIAPNTTAQGRSRNRRVEITIQRR